jgi:hypothetical protein
LDHPCASTFSAKTSEISSHAPLLHPKFHHKFVQHLQVFESHDDADVNLEMAAIISEECSLY